MSDPRPEFVLAHERSGLFWFLFILSVLLGVWFVVVLIGENEAWSDDPGRWALLPTVVWAFIGLAVMVLFIAYCLALLTIREVEPRVYRIEEHATSMSSPPTPSFLQPTDESGAKENT